MRKVVLVRQPGSPENLGPMTARKAAAFGSEHLGDEVLTPCPNPEPRPGRERARRLAAHLGDTTAFELG